MMIYRKGITKAITELKDRASSAEAIMEHTQKTFPTNVTWDNAIFLQVLTSGDFVKVGNAYQLSTRYRKKLVAATKRRRQNMEQAGVSSLWSYSNTHNKSKSSAVVSHSHTSYLSTLSPMDRLFQEQVAAAAVALKRATTPAHKEYMVAIVAAMTKLEDRTGFGHYLRDIKNYMLAQGFRAICDKCWRNNIFHETLEAGVARGDFVRMENYYKFSELFESKLDDAQPSDAAFHIQI